MQEKAFETVAATEGNPHWEELTARCQNLYEREEDVRSPFGRDYTRILHSLAYRRLKHKTQVFFNIDNDHICTRMEHVLHVESVSNTIAKRLGLNDELTKAIAMGHDLGHVPFGHHGEAVLEALSEEYLQEPFWHERNGLRFVDHIELLEDDFKKLKNLDLTYAVRDGIVAHCGELNEGVLHPRQERMALETFTQKGQYQPVTWEGCVVKIADKIAYIGRDIEDAINLGFIDKATEKKLLDMAQEGDTAVLNTTVIMHKLIIDICKNSTPEKGICLSPQYQEQLKAIKDFNYTYIYNNRRLGPFKRYAELVIREIFDVLLESYGENPWRKLAERKAYYPMTMGAFEGWLSHYCILDSIPDGVLREAAAHCENVKIYGNLEGKASYIQAILDFISGMTDRFAIKLFNELLTY